MNVWQGKTWEEASHYGSMILFETLYNLCNSPYYCADLNQFVNFHNVWIKRLWFLNREGSKLPILTNIDKESTGSEWEEISHHFKICKVDSHQATHHFNWGESTLLQKLAGI